MGGMNSNFWKVDSAVLKPLSTSFNDLEIGKLTSSELTLGATTSVNGIIDDDAMTTASAITLATSESIKAYVDTQIGGIDEFVELTDTPANYTGAGLQMVRVNTGADALEFTALTADLVGAGTLNIGANALTINSIEIVGADGEVNASAVEDKFLRNDGDDSTSGRLSVVGITNTAGVIRNVTTVNVATYDTLVSDDILNVTYTTTAAVTSLTIPTAQTVAGRTIVIKDAAGNAGTNNITIDTEGAQTIDGSATLVLSDNYASVILYSDGSNWFVM